MPSFHSLIFDLPPVGEVGNGLENSMYHAAKFGIEGFCEAAEQEVVQVHIGVTMVEPSGARTEFRYGSAKAAKLMPDYESCHGFLNMLDASKGLAP